MLQVVPKWEVAVTLSSGVRRVFWVHEHYIGNVLRQVAGMSFDANQLVFIDGVAVSLVESGRSAAAVDPHVGGTTA